MINPFRKVKKIFEEKQDLAIIVQSDPLDIFPNEDDQTN